VFFHHSDLAYKVRVDNPNPMYARMLQQAIGGPEGELRVMSQYLFQGFNARGPARYRDMLLSTGTEEIGHVEVLATAVAMNLEGAKSELVDEVATNPLIAARMGGIDPRHFLSTGGGATPADANGVPFSAGYVDAGGNLRADMRANVAAEAIGRTLATRLYEATDDPGMKDMWRFLIARDTMHQQQWLAVLEELEDPANAPGDFENEGEFAGIAYGFFNHTDTAPPDDAAWANGPSIDGKGTFHVVDPLTTSAPRPELKDAPHDMHRGPEATMASQSDGNGGDSPGLLTQLRDVLKA
jgi:Mn-containing catalase